MLEAFWDYLKQTDKELKFYFSNSPTTDLFKPDHLRQAVMSYLLRPAKRLRPAVMKLACGCLGGEEKIPYITPLAAGIELFHTWTLVHDDIIDNDDKRRGEKTAHILSRDIGQEELGLPDQIAEEYGRCVAILAGDIQHGWVASSFLETAMENSVSTDVVITLLHRLETKVISELIEGEMLDVQFSLQNQVGEVSISEKDVLKMEWLKTGALLEFSAQSGAMIAKDTRDFDDPDVQALASFAVNCGTAFQLQDDILGITGDENQLGKPIGSDIREGKKTVIVLAALENAESGDKQTLSSILGDRTANEKAVEEASRLLIDLGGVDYARNLAGHYIDRAVNSLERIPGSKYKELLFAWAEFMVNRDL
jgi:geranylgeranyl diphosphate synthase type I